MEQTNACNSRSKEEEEKERRDRSQELLETLPEEMNWNGDSLRLYQHIWLPWQALKGVLWFQQYLRPHKTDIFVASCPKSGTNWLKNLTFTIVNRSKYSLKDTPLLHTNHQLLVPLFEVELFSKDQPFPDLDSLPHPRVFATHTANASLPSSVKDNYDNKIVYICRNPLDQFVSLWHFTKSLPVYPTEEISLEEPFDKFCKGIHIWGPFWEHILGYWKASLERPNKVLFLKYEDLKEDNIFYLKKIASFLGFPFSEEEEKQELIQEISKFCSFENLQSLQVSKTGKTSNGIPNSTFYRKGKTGDWVNYLSPAMVERMDKLIEEKFKDTNFSFNMCRNA